MSEHEHQTADKQSSVAGVMSRLWWMLLGNALLAFSIIFIVQRSEGFFHTADVVFWAAVASLVLIRYVDVRFLGGQTATGAPASGRHWIKYTALLLVCSVLLWAVAHAAAYALAARTP